MNELECVCGRGGYLFPAGICVSMGTGKKCCGFFGVLISLFTHSKVTRTSIFILHVCSLDTH